MDIPLEYILKAAKSVKRLAYLIAVIGAVASYGTQVELVKSWGIDGMFAYMIPATIDILAICAAIALQVPGFPAEDRKRVGAILVVALTVSISANITAGANVGAKIAHAWPVVAYMLAEYIANRLRTYVARVLAAKAAQDVPSVETPADPIHATATVAPPAAITSKPGTAKSKILELASVKPPLSPEEIADKVGTKPGWVKHVIKTHA
jgi:hypothetical protein